MKTTCKTIEEKFEKNIGTGKAIVIGMLPFF